MTTNVTGTEVERVNIAIVEKLKVALSKRDRDAVRSAFAPDGAYRPDRKERCFDGPEQATEQLFEFVDRYKVGEFRTVRSVASGDEVFIEWRWSGVTNEGLSTQAHGVDYVRLRDGKIVVKSTYLKA